MPMQKNTTLSKRESFDPLPGNNEKKVLQPSEKTLKNIMQFAASYRVEKISNKKFIELYLN